MTLKIVIVPSREWYSSKWTNEGVGAEIHTALEGVVANLNGLKQAGFPLEAVLDIEALKTPLYANYLVVEVLLVGSPKNKAVSKLLDTDEPSDPSFYNMRVVINGDNVKLSAAEAFQRIVEAVITRPNTYVSTRIATGEGETAENASTPVSVGFYEAISRAVPKDGGLYMPRSLPRFTHAELAYLVAQQNVSSNDRFERTMQFVLEKCIGIPERLTVDNAALLKTTPFSEEAQKAKDRLFAAELNRDEAGIAAATQEINEWSAREAESGVASNKSIADKIAAQCSSLPEEIREQIMSTFNYKLVSRFGERELPSPCDIKAMLKKAYASNRGFGSKGLTFNKILPEIDERFVRDNPLEETAIGSALSAMKDVRVMELCKGPTSCYEDYSFQLFSQFFAEDKQYMVVMATNGDAGAAAIESFITNGPKTTQLFILYPEDGVTEVQKLHIHSYADAVRVHAVGVNASFEVCQRVALKMMRDTELRDNAAQSQKTLTLANACNWGRILPMIGVYVHAYVECSVKGDKEKRRVRHPLDVEDDKKRFDFPTGFDVIIPTGNLGNLVAAYTAKKMGIPIRSIVTASNENDIMFEFFQTGTFNVAKRVNRGCHANALDIVQANNIERLLYLLHDWTEVAPLPLPVPELTESEKKDMAKDREKEPITWQDRDLTQEKKAKAALERAERVKREAPLIEVDKTNIVRKLMVDLQTKRRFTVSDFVLEERIKPLFYPIKTNCTRAKEVTDIVYTASGKSRFTDPVTAISISALDMYYLRVKKEQDDKDAEQKEKERYVPFSRDYRLIYPIVLSASSHWVHNPKPCMRAIKVPLCSHSSADMPTPEGYAPPSTFCREPPKPRAPEVLQDIVRRQVATLVSRGSSADNKLTNYMKDITMPSKKMKRYSDLYVVVEGTYAAIVNQLKLFLSADNEQYSITDKDAEKEKEKEAKKFAENRKKAEKNALKRPYVKQEDLDAWKETVVPVSVLRAEKPTAEQQQAFEAARKKREETFAQYSVRITTEPTVVPVVNAAATSSAPTATAASNEPIA